ncbi:MAG: hypothetical protein WA857_21845 [Candidatus Acidiferrum sp.]
MSIPLEFGEMFDLDGVEKAAASDAPDYFDTFLAKTSGVPEIAKAEKPHADGVFVENDWRWTYEQGQLVKSEQRNAAGKWELVEEREPTPLYVEEAIAKIIGVNEMGG